MLEMLRNKKGVSPLVATIVLIGLTVVGGLTTYAVFNSTVGTTAQTIHMNFEYLALYESITDPKVAFAVTLKNTGSKPIVSLEIRLHNESNYFLPSVSSSKPLESGMSTSIVLTPPTIHAGYYVGGNYYQVAIVNAVASDGSSFSRITTVMCMGYASLPFLEKT
jgi:flagellin-like protein